MMDIYASVRTDMTAVSVKEVTARITIFSLFAFGRKCLTRRKDMFI